MADGVDALQRYLRGGAFEKNSVTYQLALLVCLEFDLEFYPPQFRCLIFPYFIALIRVQISALIEKHW